jgi:hypothetical protein
MMKGMLAFLFLASPVFAQDHAAVASASGGCGPSEVHFDVKTNESRHPVRLPEAGQALVFSLCLRGHGAPTMRVGLDGAWVGANKGKSYFFFSVEPGDHQLCTNWQSGVFKKRAIRIGSAITLTAQAGKVYYFRTQVYERSEQDYNVKLEPVESAEGQFLISASKFSTSHPRK